MTNLLELHIPDRFQVSQAARAIQMAIKEQSECGGLTKVGRPKKLFVLNPQANLKRGRDTAVFFAGIGN